MSKHIGYFDFLRGIAIMMVVAIHTFPQCSWYKTGDILQILIRLTLNCAVPIFLAISAFFLAKKSFETFDSTLVFWKRQISKVYVPCIVWSLPLFLLAILNGANPLNELIRLLLCGYSIYYFIALIIQYYLLLPLLIKVNRMGGVILFLLSIASISIYIYSGKQLPLILYAGPFWVWIMFFYQGIIMGRSQRNYPIIVLIALLLVSLVLQAIESYYLYDTGRSGFGIKATAFIYSLIVIFILFSKQCQKLYESNKNKLFSIIEYIGKLSFGIYLIHCYFIIPINKIIGIDFWAFKWLLTLAISICFIQLVKWVLPYKICTKYLGFL